MFQTDELGEDDAGSEQDDSDSLHSAGEDEDEEDEEVGWEWEVEWGWEWEYSVKRGTCTFSQRIPMDDYQRSTMFSHGSLGRRPNSLC